MKFHQLIDYNRRNIFCRKSCRNERGRLVPGTLRFGHTIKENCIKVQTIDPEICSVWYFRKGKGLGLVFPPHFVYDISRKIFLMLHFSNKLNFIVWSLIPLLLEILGNMCIIIISVLVDDVIHFESCLIKSFSQLTK